MSRQISLQTGRAQLLLQNTSACNSKEQAQPQMGRSFCTATGPGLFNPIPADRLVCRCCSGGRPSGRGGGRAAGRGGAAAASEPPCAPKAARGGRTDHQRCCAVLRDGRALLALRPPAGCLRGLPGQPCCKKCCLPCVWGLYTEDSGLSQVCCQPLTATLVCWNN